jgi:transcriptional regulator with XRE-family HTH domain
MKLPARLRQARKAVGMSASALSIAAGLSRSTAANAEAGALIPRLATVERLASALNLSPAWLAYGLAASWEPGLPSGGAGLAERAQTARAGVGLSLREVDRRAGLADGTLRAIEKGSLPSIDTVEAIAKALGVSPAWLAFGLVPTQLVAIRQPRTAMHP